MRNSIESQISITYIENFTSRANFEHLKNAAALLCFEPCTSDGHGNAQRRRRKKIRDYANLSCSVTGGF